MKTLKKSLVLLLALAMAVSVFAFGGLTMLRKRFCKKEKRAYSEKSLSR